MIQLKQSIKKMKVSMITKGKEEEYMERVNSIVERLDINYQEIDTEIEKEPRLKELHPQ